MHLFSPRFLKTINRFSAIWFNFSRSVICTYLICVFGLEFKKFNFSRSVICTYLICVFGSEFKISEQKKISNFGLWSISIMFKKLSKIKRKEIVFVIVACRCPQAKRGVQCNDFGALLVYLAKKQRTEC